MGEAALAAHMGDNGAVRARAGLILAFVLFSAAWFGLTGAGVQERGDGGWALSVGVVDGFALGLAGFACWFVWRTRPERFWRPLALALVALAAGDLLFDLSDHGMISLPSGAISPVDLLYLSAYGAMGWTTLRLVRRSDAPGAGPLLDTLIVAAGAAAALYPVVVQPYFDGSDSSAVTDLSGLYPVLDLVLVAAAAVALATRGRAPALRALGLAAVVCLVADHQLVTGQNDGSYSFGGWIDWLYPLQYLLLALALTFAVRPADEPEDDPMVASSSSDVRRYAPMVASAVICPALLVAVTFGPAFTRREDVETSYAVASLVVVSLVCARMVHVLAAHSRTVRRLRTALADRDRLSSDLEHQSSHDPVTGLPNRYDLARRAESLLDGHGGRHAVVYLDLDDFKGVNDRLGHETGDLILHEVAARLRHLTRPDDVIARLGGDEFAVLMQRCDAEHAEQVAGRMIEALNETLRIGDLSVRLSASAGVADMMPGGAGYADALTHADLAMYAAKAAGKNRVMRFAEEMRHDVLGDADLAADLVAALADGGIEPHFQPILDLHEGLVYGFEALARWTHATRGPISPGEFLPVAEARDLTAALDLQMMRKSLLHIAQWRVTHPDLRVAVNLTAATLALPDLADRVLVMLGEFGLAGDALIAEVTEQSVLADPVGVAERLELLRDSGVLIALDDFGTGYSSLSYLQQLPIDHLKLDRSFLATGTDGSTVTPLLRNVVRLGHELGMTVLAEGVETTQQLHTVTRLGCEHAQGWLFSPAVPAEAVPALLDEPVSLPFRTAGSAPATRDARGLVS